MGKAKELTVTESLSELKGFLKKSSDKIRPRIHMLPAMKRSEKMLTKYELAEQAQTV